jgi:Ran GTPase-activating protein (RanGAP) involved in mRNA processing and transport
MQPDWPPIQVREPTNLVIVSKNVFDIEEGFSEQEIETMNDDYVHGKIDNITAYKKEVELADVLSPVPSKDGESTSEPKVLMDGAPGVGKTTLAIKACSDWAKHRLFGRYELLVLVSLREVKHRKGESLADLFPCCNDKRVVEYYEKSGGKHMVMIFDGYDELSFQQRRVNSIFLDIIRGEVLPDCAILVTSRPYASSYLHELESINRHVEVLGFKKEQIYACVEKCLPDSASAKELTQQLEEREDILSLCYIPLNCMIMIHVYKQKKTLTTTMTELMHQFIIDTVTRSVKYIELSPENENVCITDLNNLPDPAGKQLHALEQLAYQNLIKDEFIFSRNDLLSVFKDLECFSESCDVTKLCLSLLTSVHTVSDNADSHFQFLHLSIQEYLAARYAVKTPRSEGERADILQKFVDEPRFRLFLLFYVGMMPMDSDTARVFFHARLLGSNVKGDHDSGIYHHQASPVVEKILYFAHMIFESQQFETFGHLFDALNNKKVLSLKYYKLTLFDCTVLSHFFCSIDHIWDELDLQHCSLGKHSLQVFERVYKHRKFDRKTTQCQFLSINFSGNDPNMLNCLEIFPWLSKVNKLSFDDQISKVSKPLDLHTITHIPQLCINVGFSSSSDTYTYPDLDPAYYYCVCKTNADEVELCQSQLGEAFGTYLHSIKVLKLTKVNCSILHMLHPFIQSLSVLVLHGIEGIDEWLSDSSEVLARSSTLQKLMLCDIGLTSLLNAKKLFQALSRNTAINEFHFSVNSERLLCQVEVLGQEIKEFLLKNNTVTSLCLHNCISDQSVKYLIVGLKCNRSLVNLDVRYNPLSINAIEELIRVAANLGTLDEISIERNVFRKQGEEWTLVSTKKVLLTENLFCALSNLSILGHCYHQVVSLSLFSDDLDTFVCVKLFQVLQQNKSVEQLTFMDKFSLIANDKSVSQALKRMFAMNTTLKKVQYHSNKNEHHCIYEHIAAGVSESLSLRRLSVKLCSVSGIPTLMRGLRNCRLHVLEITPDYRYSSSFKSLTQDDSKSIGFEFEKFLASNSTLVNLKLGFILDDGVVSGIAEGLLRNHSLKILYITLGPLVSSDRVAKLFCSANYTLTSIDINNIGSLMKVDHHWNLMLHENGVNMWSKLKCALQAGKPKYKVISPQKIMKSPGSYQVFKVFSDLALSKNLTIIDFSKLLALDNDRFSKRKIGLALKDMLTTSSSLEILIFTSSKLPDGAWEYAAEGLSSSKSLKYLDLCNCGLSASEAAGIFASLKSNHKLETLDISKNSHIKQGDHPKLNSAIEAMFQSNSSICDVNLQDSISDKAVIKAVNGLKRNQSSSLKKLVLEGRSFSFRTLQHVLQMVKDRFGLVLQFSEVTLTFSAEPNVWLKFINMLYHEYLRHTSSYLQCEYDKLFCSICHICLQHQLVINIVELELNIDDDETVITMFRLLSQETLYRLKKISLKGNFPYTISGDAVSCGLKGMLASNETLHELKLDRIDEAVATGLMSGLLENTTLISLSFTLEDLSDHFVGKLLTALNTPNSGLLKVKVSGLPLIHRPTRWSMWSMRFDGQDHFCFEHVMVSIILFPQFIYKICLCPDSRVAKSILVSLSEHVPYLSISELDITLLVGLFKTLANNHTFKALSLSAKGKTLKGENVEQLSEAIQNMLVSNTALKKLNLSGTFDSKIVRGIIDGLKRNKTLRSFQIDNYKSTSNLEFIAAIMTIFSKEESSVTSLFVKDLFTLHKYKSDSLCSSEWKIEVLNESAWCSFLNVLKNVALGVELVAVLDLLDHGGCICNSPRFDITCKRLSFQMVEKPDSEMFTGRVTQQSNSLTKDINVKLLLANVSTLEVLAIKGFHLSGDACCNIIHSGRHLKKLELTHDSITGQSALRLIHELATLTDSEGIILDELNISSNNLTQSSSDLGSVLKNLLENCKLKVLKCASCHISDAICGCIASGIQCNLELTCLDLSCNNITAVGVIELMASMQQNTCLEELNVSGNKLFAVDGTLRTRLGQAVSKMLECNHTLVNFNFDCDNLDIVTLKEISEGLTQNSNLALKILSVNINKCNTSDFSSLIPSLSTKLPCLNFSDSCSLFSSDTGWTLEVKNTNWLSQICAILSKINITKVVISRTSEPGLTFLGCHLSCLQLQSLLGSLEDNCVVKKLSLSISDSLTHTEHEYLRSSLESTLKNNCGLMHLEIVGAVSDEILQGLEAGIKINDSIRELNVPITNVQQFGIVVNFIQSLEICNIILRVELRPVIRLFRPFTSSMWQVEAHNPSVAFLKLLLLLNQGNVKHSLLSQLSLLEFGEISIDDALTSSLVQELKDNNVTSLRIPSFWTIGEKAHCTLERMISCNKCLQHLTFDTVNDSVVAAITKGLKDNKTLQVLEMNIAPVSESILSQLLQSLGNHSLKLIPQGHYIAFIRFTSDLQRKEVSVKTVTAASPNLAKILQCLSSVQCQDLTISSLQVSKAIGNSLKALLRNCTSLKVLKLQCAVNNELMQCLAAGLKENNTLSSLELNANSPSTRLCRLPFLSPATNLKEGYLLSKISGKSCWKLQQLHHFYESSFQNLCLIHNHIEIDLLICQSVGTVALKLCSENIKLTLIILKSIECGSFPVKYLHLQYGTIESDESKTIGNAIERMLTINKSLETLTIMHLKDNVFEDHIVSGLCQATTLTSVVIMDKLQSIDRNSLVQKVIRADFTDSSITEIQIDDDISLHLNSIQTDPDWRIEMDRSLGVSKAKAIPIWKINSDNKNTIIRAFFLLNHATSVNKSCKLNHSDSIGKSVLDNLRDLDVSYTCINFIALFEALQCDSKVTNLNLSHCTPAVSVDTSQKNEKLKSMLINNTSLELLNLTGLMDETLISSLIEVLPFCSLKSLSLDLSIRAYAFDKVEALVSSYASSKLIQLTFTDICHLQKEVDAQCIPQCISLECHLALPFSVSLLKSYSTLFMLITINKRFCRLNLTLGSMDRLTLKVYRMFFTSVSSGCQMDSPIAPMSLLQSLKALQIDITHNTCDLVVAIMESLQCCRTSRLEELRLSHDKSIFMSTSKCQALASCYEQLISSNETLQTVNFGHINDEIAQGVVAGLKSSQSKLSTLQVNTSLLTTKSVTSLFQVFLNGSLIFLQITDGMFINKTEEGSSYIIDVFGDNVFLCKIFIAISQVKASPDHCSKLMTSFVTEHKLDFRVQSVHSAQPLSIRSMLANDVIWHIIARGGSYVTELILSGNTELTKDDEDLVGSALEQLLTSDQCTLCSLKLDACQIPDAVCVKISEGLEENKSLKTLDLSCNLLTSYGVSKLLVSLATNDTLMEIDLSDNELSDSQAINDETGNEIKDMIKENCTLTKLHLISEHNCLCPFIAEKIAAGLCDNTALQVLSLQIKEEQLLVKLFDSLQHNQILNELNIEESLITNTLVGSSIQNMLKCNRSLEILKMRYSGITDEVCDQIADGLSNNKQLKTLNLCNNRICSSGMIKLFQVLDTNNCCLKELDVSLNCDSQWRASDNVQLDTILATNTSLEVLIISDGGYFGEWFGLELFKGLQCNSKLHTLDISRNYFDATASKAFTKMIECNKMLTKLDIYYCQFSFWHLNFTKCSLKKVIISAEFRGLFDDETSEIEIELIQAH